MRGLFVSFEGPEGSGKSTQVELLTQNLEKAGYRVMFVREPGGTPAGEAIRTILQHDKSGDGLCAEAEALLFSASRAQLVRAVIEPALAGGVCVICDRFTDSTTVYQGYARGIDLDFLRGLNAFATNRRNPDLTILLDIDAKLGLERLAARCV